MEKVPAKVQEAFDELKILYGRSLELKFLKGKFCIFDIQATIKNNKNKKDPTRATNYIGYITKYGIIVPVLAKHRSTRSKNLQFEGIEKFNIKYNKKESTNKFANKKLNRADINLLKALSMNSRLTFKRISEITGISIHALEYRIERLERIWGIKYTLELNMNNLGFSEYMILAKFTRSKPDFERIKKALERNPMIQLALATKGIYDLVIFCVAENNNAVAEVLDNIRNSEILNKIEAEWYITPIAVDYGFIPLKKEFFDILKERVWHRKKRRDHSNLSSLMYREYVLLRELNEDSRKSFSSIDKKYNLPAGSAKRAYKDLTNEDGKNVIIRPTLTLTLINKRYDGIIIADIINKEKFVETKHNHRKYIINEPDEVVNRFAYISDMETPDGIFYLFPILKEGDKEKIENELSETINGVKFNSLIVENVIIGNISYRKFDNLYSKQYLNLVKINSTPAVERVIYN